MGQSSDEIRREIDKNRRDATEKIDRLQDQVQGTADDLRTQATETAQDVREQVGSTVDDTIETVKESLNFEEMVQERPLVSVGAALVAGFVLGGMLDGGGDKSHRAAHTSASSGGEAAQSRTGGGIGDTVRDAFRKSGLEETFSNATAALVSSVTDQVKGTVDRNVPGFADRMDQASQSSGSVMDKTRKTQP